MIAKGWLLDLYVQGDFLILWFRLNSGELLRLTDSFSFLFYAQGPKFALRILEKKLAPYIRHTAWTRRIEFWSGKTISVLEISIRSLEKIPEVLRLLAAGSEGLTFYNCDLGIPQYYAWQKGLFPLCSCEIEWERNALKRVTVLDSPWGLDASFPDLRVMEVELTAHSQIPLNKGNSLRVTFDNTSFDLEASGVTELLKELNHLVTEYDPDLFLSRHGDAQIFPFLWQASQKEKKLCFWIGTPIPPVGCE